MNRIRVHLLTENRLLRDSLARLLSKRSDLRVCVHQSVLSAAEELASSQCQVLLTDCLAAPNGIDLLRKICQGDPRIKVVLFGMEEDLEDFLTAIHMGVSGYILKNAPASQILASIGAVARCEAVCPPQLCGKLIQHMAHEARSKPNGSPRLTARQLELMVLVAQGLTNKEIASSLHLSEMTVKNHIRRILRQVDARDRHQAVAAARVMGLLPPSN